MIRLDALVQADTTHYQSFAPPKKHVKFRQEEKEEQTTEMVTKEEILMAKDFQDKIDS